MKKAIQLRILYFAALREQAGCAEESVSTTAGTPSELYTEQAARHGFTLPLKNVRAAVNGTYAPTDKPVMDGDTIAFIPPVAGG